MEPQKWQSYPSGVPRSGMGSTETASANFRLGLANIVTFIKTTLKKDVISILGQAFIHTLIAFNINNNRFSLRLILWRHELDANVSQR